MSYNNLIRTLLLLLATLTSLTAMEFGGNFSTILIGDTNTGKTAILYRYIHNTFTEEQGPTIGIDYFKKSLIINNQEISLKIWDTAGQERFRSVIPQFYKDNNALILCYDTTNKASFTKLNDFSKEVKKHASDQCVVFLCGTKTDLTDKQNTPSDEEIKQMLLKFNTKHIYDQVKDNLHIQVSAKTGHNITELFQTVVTTTLTLNPQQSKINMRPTSTTSPDEQVVKPDSNKTNDTNATKNNILSYLGIGGLALIAIGILARVITPKKPPKPKKRAKPTTKSL